MLMKQLTAQGVIPVTELKISPAAVVKTAQEKGPLLVTVEGKPALVCMSPADYDELVLWASIGRGSADSLAGRTIPHEEMKRRMAAKRAEREAPGTKKAAAK
jgi:prevent-host-death family protein